MTRGLVACATLSGLLVILYAVWPSAAIESLLYDPDVGFQAPWEDADEPAESNTAVTPASLPETSPNAMRVLFVGNSHTYANGMPDMIASLARAADEERPFAASMEVLGGARLEHHLKAGRVSARLATGRWDYVVLQEQQQWPSFAAKQREREFYAPARTLDVMIRAVGAKTVFFVTWARREGDRDNRSDDTYEAMQARTREGYLEIARELGARIAPVGMAWQSAHVLRPELPLWEPDGSHATPLGSYLAACVLYGTLYGHSPEDNPFTAGLSANDAAFLQRAAGRALHSRAY